MASSTYVGRDFVHQSMYGSAPTMPQVRDCRRSDASCSRAASQPRRTSSSGPGENSGPRWRNPRLSSGLAPPRLPCGMSGAAVRLGTALSDITNVGTDRSSKDKKLRAHSGYDADAGRSGMKDREPSCERLAPAEAVPPLVALPVVAADLNYSHCQSCHAEYRVPEPYGGVCCGRPVQNGRSSKAIASDYISPKLDSSDVQNVSEYATEIYEQLFRKEKHYQPRPEYMDSQIDINSRMRAILIDWLIEVHMKYRLRPETLFLTVNLLDRYLSLAIVPRKILQLVGVVAMFVASKFEEISPPEVHDFVYITDNAYTKEDIVTLECTMLTALNFQVVVPTALSFTDRLQRLNRCDGAHRELAHYIVELALLELRMTRYAPSHLAAAALLLSNLLLGRRPAWPSIMAQHSRYVEPTLQLCVEELRALLEAVPTNSLQAVRKKYALSERQFVARMTFPSS